MIIFWIILVVIVLTYYLFLSSMGQIFGYFPYKGKTKEKVIALTFDDGPNGTETERLLDVLKKHDVPATFFACGDNVKKYPEIVKRAHEEGHIIGDHLMSHHFPVFFNEALFEKELLEGRKAIKDAIGLTVNLYRAPWLFRTPKLLQIVNKHGFTPVSGIFISWIETLRPPTWLIARTGLLQTKPGRILIGHDGNETKGGPRVQSIDAIDTIIPVLKKRGYTFVTVDKILRVRPYAEM